MIQSKRIGIMVAAAVAIALIISAALVIIANMQSANGGSEPEYATKIFGADIISIEIIADEADWQEMLENAIDEQYITADVVVNGTKFQKVGIRPKGNSSLTQVASSDSDRYSFRLQFNEYIKGQTCFGLESLVLNNMLGDNTYMKEYVSYELMREAGVSAPYFGYADIKANGESWGLYLAVELYNENYEQRVFGNTSGMLYNVKSMDMGGTRQNPPDNVGDQAFSPSDGKARSDFGQAPNTDRTMSPAEMDGEIKGMDRNFEGKGGRGSSGGSLEYTDDKSGSYSAIFNNVVGKGTESDFQRVVQALKALSEGQELETYFDVDQILRYLAAHTMVVNLDSYSSSMAQNYYIYERNGQITILPWDYNLAWGGFQNGDASSVINFPIDTPLSGVEMSSRPLIEKLFANPEYLEKYHSYLQELVNNYFVNGKFGQKILELDALISDYVKNDATAFCTYEEYRTAVSAFIALGDLRAKSVQGQLDGTVPSTTQEQKTSSDQLIAAGDLKLSDLGSMMGGKGGNKGGFPDRMNGPDKDSSPGGADNGIDPEIISKAMDIIRQANGEIGDEEKEALLSLGATEEQIEQFSAISGGRLGGGPQNGESRRPPDNTGGMESRGQARNTSAPSGANISAGSGLGTDNLILVGVLSLVLIVALLFAARFKKNY